MSSFSILFRQLGLIAISAIGLGISFVNDDLFLLPWICFIPFLFALKDVTVKRAYCLGLIFGVIFFVIASFWIVGFLLKMSDITVAYAISLASIYWIYCAQQFALLAAAIVWFSKREPCSEWLSLSLFSTLLFYALPLIFPADLSVTQSKFLLALQGVDLTGSLGLHFLILLHNGLFYALIKSANKKLNFYHYAAVGFFSVWFIYGFGAYRYWSNEEKHWPIINVGVVQPHSEASVKIPPAPAGFSRAYPVEIELSLALAQAGVSLIVWPEARYRGFFNETYVRDAFKYHANEVGTSFLIQDLKTQDNLTFNSSALIGEGSVQEYSKYLRIPFGEYLPGENLPLLGEVIKNIFGDFYTPISIGSANAPMNIQHIKVQPLICFEVAQAYYLADLVKAAVTQKNAIQLLIVQSNDSWFDTDIEPRLHLMTSQLRSVEQRLPLVHALNNGPSSVYKASGQLVARLPAHERSAAVVRVAYPEKTMLTVFGRFPYGFMLIILMITISWVLLLMIRRFYRSSAS